MKDQHHKHTTIIALIFQFVLATYVQASSPQIAQVGQYNDHGKIELMEDVFLDATANGRPIISLEVIEDDGFLLVARTIQNEGVACLQERLQLVDKQATPLTTGSDPLSGKAVYLYSRFATHVSRCLDSGCMALKSLEIPGEFKINAASCSIDETSHSRCACQIDRGRGAEIIRNRELCKTMLDHKPTELEHWIEANSVETIE